MNPAAGATVRVASPGGDGEDDGCGCTSTGEAHRTGWPAWLLAVATRVEREPAAA